LGIFENYRYALTNPDMLLALRNNALWLLLMVPGTIAGGLFFALLADRVRYESIAKAIIFLPTAIPSSAPALSGGFVYDVESGGGPQIGLLNPLSLGWEQGSYLVEQSGHQQLFH